MTEHTKTNLLNEHGMYGGIHNDEYKSLSELCKAYKVNYGTFYTMLTYGRSIEYVCKLYDIKREAKRLGKSVVRLNGEYHIVDFADLKKKGLTTDAINHRLRSGMSFEEAISKPAADNNKNRIVMYKGNCYLSVAELCRELGIKYDTVIQYRNKYDISTEQAVDEVIAITKDKRKKAISECAVRKSDVLNGVKNTEEKSRLTEKHNSNNKKDSDFKVIDISNGKYDKYRKTTVKNSEDTKSSDDYRVIDISSGVDEHYNKDKQIKIEEHSNNKCIEYNGNKYASVKELSIALKLKVNSVINFMKNGNNIKDAIELAMIKRELDKNRISKLCHDIGISYDEVYEYYINNNIGINQAIEYISKKHNK